MRILPSTMNHGGSGFLQFFSLLLIAFAVALVARRVRAPYALALVATGLVVGASRLLPNTHLDPSTLLTVFLPPLLFESAIQLRADALKRDWLPISVFALLGTALSTVIVGGLATWILRIPIASAMVFGALISATDPISVIAVFKQLGTDRRLTLIVEAESLFNDSVAIVLLTILIGAAAGGKINPGFALLQFFQLAAGGALVGLILGMGASRIHYEVEDHLVEITLTSVVAFGSYLVAERLHFSGVMAVIVAGLVIGNYGMPRTMSPSTRLAVSAFWEYAVFVVNSLVFLLIGIEVHYVRWTDKLVPTLCAIGIVLVGRSAIYPLSLLVNRLKGEIPASWQGVLFWGSLRGALSMALALNLAPTFPQRSLLIAATFGVVLFSLLVQGLTVGPLLRVLGLSAADSNTGEDSLRLASEIVACEAALFQLQRIRETEAHPIWAVELLIQNYRNKLGEMKEEMARVDPNYAAGSEQQALRAQEAALHAEKSALHEASRLGRLSEQDWREMRALIDTKLVSLARNRTGSGSEENR